MRYAYSIIPLILIMSLFLPAALGAEELEMINRPVNTSGLTGLIMTTSPYTLSKKTVEIGLMALSENSLVPNYTLTAYPLTISAGISRSMELAIKGTYYYLNEDPETISRGMGDTELAWKWNFRPQTESSLAPGIALMVTGIIPTADNESETRSVQHWGGRIGISIGSEIVWEDHIIGLFADGQFAAQDSSDELRRDSYSLFNAGIIVPISKYRNLQMMMEYNQRARSKNSGRSEQLNSTGVTYGLRLVGERINFTFGTQFLHRSESGYQNSNRVIGMITVKF